MFGESIKYSYQGENNMNSIGLDIWTTTICAIILDSDTGSVLESITEPNMSFFPTESPWGKCQDVGVIWQEAISIVQRLIKKYAPVGSIGVTGQMHGIVYIDNTGMAVSPLYTWQHVWKMLVILKILLKFQQLSMEPGPSPKNAVI